MCGIFGGHHELLQQQPDELLKHRGPDQSGQVEFIDRRSRPFVFGCTRLNVVDHHDISVPFQAAGATIVYNGEVYNWRSLRTELESYGVRFETQTDTEVVLHAYLVWGSDCLNKFNVFFGRRNMKFIK